MTQIVQHHIGLLHEVVEHAFAHPILGVDRQRLLASVDSHEECRLVLDVWAESTTQVPCRWLHLDDPGSEICQEHARVGSCDEIAELDYDCPV